METTGKRKEAPNDRNGGPAFKKKKVGYISIPQSWLAITTTSSVRHDATHKRLKHFFQLLTTFKGGNAGRWKTPHQQQKAVAPRFGTIEPGDTGIWATCARHMEGRAAGELRMLFDEVRWLLRPLIAPCLDDTDSLAGQYALKLYGINTQEDARAEDEDEDEGEDADIESSIRKEIGTLKAPKKDSTDQVFTEIRVKDDCLLFIRAKTPVKPVEFVKRICEDIKSSADGATKKTRYINRLTPITVMGKATASGVEEVARQVLPDHFTLRPAEQESQAGETRDSQGPEASPAHSVGYGYIHITLDSPLTPARSVRHSDIPTQPQCTKPG